MSAVVIVAPVFAETRKAFFLLGGGGLSAASFSSTPNNPNLK